MDVVAVEPVGVAVAPPVDADERAPGSRLAMARSRSWTSPGTSK